MAAYDNIPLRNFKTPVQEGIEGGAAAPTVPVTTPSVQDIIDVLVALGLVVQTD